MALDSIMKKVDELDKKVESDASGFVETSSPASVEPTQSTEIIEEKAAYVPNLKYKVLDQEKEFDKHFHQFIKSKEDEEKFRDLFTKADGIDVVKGNLHKTKEDLQREASEKTQLVNVIQQLKKNVDSGDYDDFLDAWGIDDNKLFQHVMKKIKLMENPELKAQYDESVRNRREKDTFASERETLKAEKDSLLQKQYLMEMDYSMRQPQTQDFASKFDSMPGHKPGDFEEEVLKHGYFVNLKTGVDIPVSQAVSETMQKYSGFIGSQQTQVQTPVETRVSTKSEMVKDKTIPNLGPSSSNSPTKSNITNLKALEAARDAYLRRV